MTVADRAEPLEELISNAQDVYGERFQEHLFEQYKLYVESAQRVSEKRISTGNFLLAVSSSMLTVFGIASTQRIGGAWLVIIPLAGLLVTLAWFSLIKAYKDLNTAKFRVIHELERHLPAALFRYEWRTCEQGKGSAYKPITHHERWVPLAFAGVFLVLGIYAVIPRLPEKKDATPVAISGSVEVNLRSAGTATNQAQQTPPTAAKPQKATHQRR